MGSSGAGFGEGVLSLPESLAVNLSLGLMMSHRTPLPFLLCWCCRKARQKPNWRRAVIDPVSSSPQY